MNPRQPLLRPIDPVTACHEAGHAVCATLLGGKLKSVDARFLSETEKGRTDIVDGSLSLDNEAACAVAGMFGETFRSQILFAEPKGTERDLSDLHKVIDKVKPLDPVTYMRNAERRAEDNLRSKQGRCAIHRLAQAPIETGYLGGKDAMKLVHSCEAAG